MNSGRVAEFIVGMNIAAESRGNPVNVGLRVLIEDIVARAFLVPTRYLRLRTRGPAPAAFARQVAMYLAHVGCGLTLTEVGMLFGRDRTTVSHACNLVEDRRDNPRLDRALYLLEFAIRGLAEFTHSGIRTELNIKTSTCHVQ